MTQATVPTRKVAEFVRDDRDQLLATQASQKRDAKRENAARTQHAKQASGLRGAGIEFLVEEDLHGSGCAKPSVQYFKFTEQLRCLGLAQLTAFDPKCWSE